MSDVLKGKTSPLQTGKFQNHIVNVDILILVNVENCQRGQPLRTHGAANDRVLRRGTLRKMKILQAVQKVTVCRYVCLRGLRSSGYEISFHLSDLLYDLIYDWFIDFILNFPIDLNSVFNVRTAFILYQIAERTKPADLIFKNIFRQSPDIFGNFRCI